jgi:hypothetical protein
MITNELKNKIVRNLLYLIAVVLIISWTIGFIGYHVGGLIDILLVIAIIAIILKVIRQNNPI